MPYIIKNRTTVFGKSCEDVVAVNLREVATKVVSLSGRQKERERDGFGKNWQKQGKACFFVNLFGFVKFLW